MEDPNTSEAAFEQFELVGEEVVRLQWAEGGKSLAWRSFAAEWLAIRAREAATAKGETEGFRVATGQSRVVEAGDQSTSLMKQAENSEPAVVSTNRQTIIAQRAQMLAIASIALSFLSILISLLRR